MRKLIYPCECDFHEDWKELGLDSPYTYESTDKDTIDVLGKECYIISGPHSSKSSKYRICKGYFHKSSMYGICFSGHEVDKNDRRIKGCGPDTYCPRYTWSDFLIFLELPVIDRNKLTALIFDTYNEAKECLDDFLKFRKERNEKLWNEYINSPKITNEYDTKLKSIITCLSILENKTEYIQAIRDIHNILIKTKLL